MLVYGNEIGKSDPRVVKAVEAAKAFALERGLGHDLQRQLDYLDGYANGPGCSYESDDKTGTACFLGVDFCPYSFRFAMCRRDETGKTYTYWFNGGLIYYGPGDDGVSDPQYSVRIGDTTKAGWTINT